MRTVDSYVLKGLIWVETPMKASGEATSIGFRQKVAVAGGRLQECKALGRHRRQRALEHAGACGLWVEVSEPLEDCMEALVPDRHGTKLQPFRWRLGHQPAGRFGCWPAGRCVCSAGVSGRHCLS